MRAHEAGAVHAELGDPHPATPPPPADPDLLAPGVWPASARRRDDGVVELAGHDVRDLAATLGTPVFLTDEDDFRARLAAWSEAFGDADVFYAGKAFLSVAVARWVEEAGLGLDVCSGGELAVALRAGFPADRVAFHGNNKSVAELAAALDAGVGRVVVDSHHEIVRLAALAEERGVVQDVLVRVTTGVEAHTHEFIATAHEDQKFGFSLAGGEAAEAVRRVLRLPSLRLVGLHSHIGSQIFDTSGFEVAAHRVVGLLAEIRDEHDGLELPELDLGGGLGIAYTPDDDPPAPAEVAQGLRAIVERECAALGLTVPRLSVEPGRAIAGPPTMTLYEVGTVKPVEVGPGLTRTYVSVDGGMSDNIRTALYGASYTCALVSRSSSAPPVLCRVVGKHCESGDVVVDTAWLPGDLAPGDLVAVAATGAYCRSMASTIPRAAPAGGGRPVREVPRPLLRRETVEDLLALDVG